MISTNLWIHWQHSQSLTRKPHIVPSAEVSVLGDDVDTICADSLGVVAIPLQVLVSLWNQVFGHVAWIPADPVQEAKPFRTETLILAPNTTAALTLPRTMGRTYL